MNEIFKSTNFVISLSPLDIQNGRGSELTKLTDEESKNWLTGNYEIIDGEIVEKTVTPPTNEEQKAKREIAYADVSKGSDRLFIECMRLSALDSDDAETKRQEWLTRCEEIKLEFPFS